MRRAILNCSSAPSATESTANRSGGSAGSGLQSAGSGNAASGARSKSNIPSSTAAKPSTIAWWTLPSTAARSAPTRGTTRMLHSGRERSSG